MDGRPSAVVPADGLPSQLKSGLRPGPVLHTTSFQHWRPSGSAGAQVPGAVGAVCSMSNALLRQGEGVAGARAELDEGDAVLDLEVRCDLVHLGADEAAIGARVER